MIPYSESVASVAEKGKEGGKLDMSIVMGSVFFWGVTIAAVIGCSDVTAWLG